MPNEDGRSPPLFHNLQVTLEDSPMEFPWETAWPLLQPYLVNVVRNKLSQFDICNADDVAADVRLRFFKTLKYSRLNGYSGEQKSKAIIKLLHKVVRSVLVDRIRKQCPPEEDDLDPQTVLPFEKVPTSQEMKEALASLLSTDREIILLRKIDHFSYEEIQQLYWRRYKQLISTSALRMRSKRAMVRLIVQLLKK